MTSPTPDTNRDLIEKWKQPHVVVLLDELVAMESRIVGQLVEANRSYLKQVNELDHTLAKVRTMIAEIKHGHTP